MRLSPPDAAHMLSRELDLLGQLNTVYGEAAAALASLDYGRAQCCVTAADPILADLQHVQHALVGLGIELSPELRQRTREVKGRHEALVARVVGEQGAIRREQARLVTARRCLTGYRRDQDPSARLDGTA